MFLSPSEQESEEEKEERLISHCSFKHNQECRKKIGKLPLKESQKGESNYFRYYDSSNISKREMSDCL